MSAANDAELDSRFSLLTLQCFIWQKFTFVSGGLPQNCSTFSAKMSEISHINKNLIFVALILCVANLFGKRFFQKFLTI